MSKTLAQNYERDRRVWDACAEVYEQEIVDGHPDVTAYEDFEEDLLDRMLIHLVRDRGHKIHLYDVGCGSARLHLRYGLKICREDSLPADQAEKVRRARIVNPGCPFDPILADGIVSVGGIDFSAEMIRLARQKLIASGLAHMTTHGKLYFQEGSAFELEPMKPEPLPVAVSVCNSLGVMQGPEGAVELFKSMRRAVESCGGIAMISSYRAEAVGSHALGNYESTMNVSGQPKWVGPDDYAGPDYVKIPRAYKRAHDPDPSIVVDVQDRNGETVCEGLKLQRDEEAVKSMKQSGRIRTHTDYESNWYSFEQVDRWIAEHWPEGKSYHLAGKSIDALRGEPAQLSILDMNGELSDIVSRWETTDHG